MRILVYHSTIPLETCNCFVYYNVMFKDKSVFQGVMHVFKWTYLYILSAQPAHFVHLKVERVTVSLSLRPINLDFLGKEIRDMYMIVLGSVSA